MVLRALAILLLALAASGPAGGDTRLDPKAPQGALAGRIQYPAGVAPAMRICALAPGRAHCVDSPAGRTLYRIERLPDGDYQVVARVHAGDTPVAGHVQPVQCLRAPCDEPLATLSIAGGREIATADLNGFYASRPDFPAPPDLDASLD